MAMSQHLPVHAPKIRWAVLLLVMLLAAAGCGGEADVDAPTGDQAEEPIATTPPAEEQAEEAEEAEEGEPVTFVAVDIDYQDAPDNLSAGEHTFELVNDGNLPHTVTIEELGDRDVVTTEGGETGTGDVELDTGTYTYYCSVPGHREAGMEGTLEVADGA